MALTLAAAGIPNVRALQGGWRGWVAEQGAIEKGPPKAW